MRIIFRSLRRREYFVKQSEVNPFLRRGWLCLEHDFSPSCSNFKGAFLPSPVTTDFFSETLYLLLNFWNGLQNALQEQIITVINMVMIIFSESAFP